jgi:hypothetical protein
MNCLSCIAFFLVAPLSWTLLIAYLQTMVMVCLQVITSVSSAEQIANILLTAGSCLAQNKINEDDYYVIKMQRTH